MEVDSMRCTEGLALYHLHGFLSSRLEFSTKLRYGLIDPHERLFVASQKELCV